MDANVENIRNYFCTIRKALGCYKCRKICFDPSIVRCGHNFCKKCIQDLKNLNLNCPLCVTQPITRRGVLQNEELGKVITQFHKLEDAFKADTHFDVTQDGFEPSHIIYNSKECEHSTPTTPLKILESTSGEVTRIAPRRKNSVPDTEYFARFKNLTLRKSRIVSNKSPTTDNARNSVQVEGLQDKEDDAHIVYTSKDFVNIQSRSSDRIEPLHINCESTNSEQNGSNRSSVEIEGPKDEEDDGSDNPDTESKQGERSLSISSHESDEDFEEKQKEVEQDLTEQQNLSTYSVPVESDKTLEEQEQVEQSLTEEHNLSLYSVPVESDKSFEEQEHVEQSLTEEPNLSVYSVPVESDKSFEEQEEMEKSLTEKQNTSRSSDPAESDKSREEQEEMEISLIDEQSTSRSSDPTESDKSREEQEEMEKSLTEEQNPSRYSDPVESDKSREEQMEEERRLTEEQYASSTSLYSISVESDKSFEEQEHVEQSLPDEQKLRLYSVPVESDKSREEQMEEEQSFREEQYPSSSSSSCFSIPVEPDNTFEDQDEVRQSLTDEQNSSSSRQYYVLVKSKEDEEILIDKESLSLSSHKSDQAESDENQEEEENVMQSSGFSEESMRSSSHISDEIEPYYEVDGNSIKQKFPSDAELYTEDMDIQVSPLENFEVPDSEEHKNKRLDPFPEMVHTVSQFNNETQPLEESVTIPPSMSAVTAGDSVIFLKSVIAAEESANSNRTLDLVSPPANESPRSIYTTNLSQILDLDSPRAVESQNINKKLRGVRKKLDKMSISSERRKNVPFFKAHRLSKVGRNVLFHYCGNLSRRRVSLVDKDIVTVVSLDEMKSNLSKKSPANKNLFDFGFQRLRGSLNPDTSKLNENSHLGKRKQSRSKAKNVLENFKGHKGAKNSQVLLEKSGEELAIESSNKVKQATENVEVPIGINQNDANLENLVHDSSTTEDLADYYRSIMKNNLSESTTKYNSKTTTNTSVISDSEMTTESLDNQVAGENLKGLEFLSASGTNPLEAEDQLHNLKFNEEKRVETRNWIKSQLLSCNVKTTQISQKCVTRVSGQSEERPTETLRAAVEDDDICATFQLEKLRFSSKESQNKDILEDVGDDCVNEELILLADGSKTPKRPSLSRNRNTSGDIENKRSKPRVGTIINESEVIILSSGDEDTLEEQYHLTLPAKQEPTSLDESNIKTTARRVRRTNAHNSFDWKIKKRIPKE